jgi:integrase
VAQSQVPQSGYVIEYQGGPITHVKNSLSTAAEKAGVKIKRMYDIRHLWITTMVNAKEKLESIASIAGTSTRIIHSNYYDKTDEHAALVKSIPDVFDKPTSDKNVVKIRKHRKKSE